MEASTAVPWTRRPVRLLRPVLIAATLLALTFFLAACDGGPASPSEASLTATITAPEESPAMRIGALLLSIDLPVEGIKSDQGHVVVLREPDRTVVALLMSGSSPRRAPSETISFRMTAPGGAMPSIRVLEVADEADELRSDGDAFSVDIRTGGN